MIFSSCSCLFHDAETTSRRDPTGTTGTRKKYERDMVRRFTRLRRLVREAVVRQDVLGLAGSGGANAAVFSRVYAAPPSGGQTQTRDAAAPPGKAFQFVRSGEKVAGFMDWLRGAAREEILEISFGTTMTKAANASWQNVYIDSAYQKGIRDAAGKAGAGARYSVSSAFNRPVHADKIGLIYTRAFEELSGVTEVMATQMSRVLAQGLVEGKGPMAIARALEDRVDKIGITRARVIARTETISAHAEGMLNTFEEMEVEGVEVMAEFATAGDDQVCPLCEELEDKEYTLDEARGLIPVHPNCRCTFQPLVKS